MRKETKRRLQRGLAMEYALVMILIVTTLGGLILMLAQLTVRSADEYADYTESKLFLDEVGSAAIEKYAEGKEIDLSQYEEGAAAFGYTLRETTEENPTVTVLNGRQVLLYIQFGKSNDNAGSYKLTWYCYYAGYTTLTGEET